MTDLPRYNFRETEAKWQRHWQQTGVFNAQDKSAKPKYYVLEQFPYPSGHLHMGHVRVYTLGDVAARTKFMQGYNVLHPMGWDAFGLPAENAAIEKKAHPEDWTMSNIATMREQLKLLGVSYDWSRELATCTPDYYKHEQLFFLKFLEKGLAYRKEAEVNWDPVDHTVLANEQVIEGRGWRSGAVVERRKLSQWFLRITDFADDLLDDLKSLEKWPDKVRLMQERWIGKSQGCLMKLQLSGKWQVASGKKPEYLEMYTTRPDTIFGMSFCAISLNHPLAALLATSHLPLATFIAECNKLGTSEEAIEKAEKKGFDTGLTIKHPFEDREVPLYVANFVLMDYGTGAIFGCPAHDQRDFEFARKYGLPVLPVIQSPVSREAAAQDLVQSEKDPAQPLRCSQDLDGTLINSGFLNGLSVEEAKKKAIAELVKIHAGAARTNYRLRDWGVSRQRYWGCPIPIIHCESCGAVPVPAKDLPVELPRDVAFDKPGNPLDRHPTWKHVPCPICKAPARRETDTFDTFFESSWYFARYATLPSPDPLEPSSIAAWLPVDCYIGGIEHAVLHLLYSRFFMRALKKCGYGVPAEPFTRLETQGMICHETYRSADGKWLSPDEVMKNDQGTWVEMASQQPVSTGRIEKMSKSKKNTVDPRRIIETYGADAARLFMLSDSPPERDLEWTDAGIEGSWKYINRLWKLALEVASGKWQVTSKETPLATCHLPLATPLQKATHKTIAAVTADIERFHFNKAIARIRELTNLIEDSGFGIQDSDNKASSPESRIPNPESLREAIEVALQLLNPFMPHVTEELWQRLGHKEPLSARPWPKADPAFLVDDEVTLAVQINGKLKTTITLSRDIDNAQAQNKVLELQAVKDALKDKQVKKIIVVPGRIVNVVAN